VILIPYAVHIICSAYCSADEDSLKRKKAKKRSSSEIRPKQKKQRKLPDKHVTGQKELCVDKKESR